MSAQHGAALPHHPAAQLAASIAILFVDVFMIRRKIK